MSIVTVSNGGIRLSADPLVETVIVAEEPGAADKWIAERTRAGDVVVIGDTPGREMRRGRRAGGPNLTARC
jgi:uncharacterized protein